MVVYVLIIRNFLEKVTYETNRQMTIKSMEHYQECKQLKINLTLKALITAAADDKFCDIFPNFQQK